MIKKRQSKKNNKNSNKGQKLKRKIKTTVAQLQVVLEVKTIKISFRKTWDINQIYSQLHIYTFKSFLTDNIIKGIKEIKLYIREFANNLFNRFNERRWKIIYIYIYTEIN